MKVHELATGRLVACPPTASLSFAAWELWVRDSKVLAIVLDGKVAGFVTERELPPEMPEPAGSSLEITVGDIMRESYPSCRCDEDVELAIDLMTREGLPRLSVLDSEGLPWGLLSVNDALLKRRASEEPSGIAFDPVITAAR